MWQTFLAIAYKELLQVRRDSTIVRAFAIAQCLDIAGIAWLDTRVRNVPTVIVDQDHTPASRELVNRLAATQTFEFKYQTSSTEQARSHLRAGRAKVAFIIPPDYARSRAGGHDAQVLALIDGSDSITSEQAAASLEGVAAQVNLEDAAARGGEQPVTGRVEARSVPLFNPDGSVPFFMLPGLLALLLFSYYSDRAISVAAEREEGHLERLLMTPMSYTGFLLGKLVPYLIVALVNGLLYLLVMRWGFSIPIRGNVALLLAGLTLYVLTVLSVCSFMAAGAKTQYDAFMRVVIFLLPAEMLSGYFFPLSALPKWLLPVSYALPQTHFVEIMRGVCLRGAGLADLAPHFLFLAVAPIVLIYGARRQFARSIMG